MLRMNRLAIIFFIGLCHVYHGCGQPGAEFPNNYHPTKIPSRTNSIISASQDFENLSFVPNGFSILEQFKEKFLKDLLTNSSDDRCSQDMKYVFQNPLANDRLGMKMLDAFGKPESGITEGNVKWIGNYYECTKIYVPPNEGSTAGDFHGQYCLLDMEVGALNYSAPISLGICLPDSCDSVPVKSLPPSQMGFDFNITKKTCQPISKKMTGAAIAMIFLLSIFVMLAIMGSSITAYEYIVEKSSQNTPALHNGGIVEGDTNLQIQDTSSIASILSNQRNNNGWYGTAREFFNCFCVFTNGEKLLSTSGTEGQLLCIHGIRFLSMTWVIVGHTYLGLQVGLANFLEASAAFDALPFQILERGTYAVDSFFLLSGFLLAYLYFQESAKTKGKIPWLYFYIHRYVRLTPVYMVVLGFSASLQYYMGSGPFWPTSEIEPVCQKNWWYNILYINNFAPMSKQCMPWTWYLANDMQFFIISPVLLITLWKWPKIGYSVLGLFMTVTVAANFGLTFYYKLHSGYQLGNGVDSLANAVIAELAVQQNIYFQQIYIKPYTRMSPYLLGIALAYYLFTRKQNDAGKLNVITLICGWMIAAAAALTCVFSLYHRKLSLLESAFYNGLGHAAFAGGLGWVIFTCLTNHAGPVDKILSFKLFIPLSRLTYCAYLIHSLIITGYFQALKATVQFSHMTMVTIFLGLLAITYAISFVASVLFESPIIRLDKLVRTKLK